MGSAIAFARVATLVLSLSMVACVSPEARYEPLSFEEPTSVQTGYTETEVQPGIFLVQFIGNAHTPADRPANYALLRGAELCLKQEKKFLFVGSPHTQLAVTGTIPGSVTTVPASETTQVVSTPAPGLPVSPIGGVMVACATTQSAGAWDAEFLARSIRTKYSMP